MNMEQEKAANVREPFAAGNTTSKEVQTLHKAIVPKISGRDIDKMRALQRPRQCGHKGSGTDTVIAAHAAHMPVQGGERCHE